MPPGAVGAANALPPMVEAAAADAALAIRNSRLLNFVMSPAPSVRTDGPALSRLYGLTSGLTYQDGGEESVRQGSPWVKYGAATTNASHQLTGIYPLGWTRRSGKTSRTCPGWFAPVVHKSAGSAASR